MGANTHEYNKTLAERLEEDHEKSYIGKKYQTLGQKLGPAGLIGSSFAPILGSMAGSTLQHGDLADYADYASMGGSAIGALAAPIMYRSMQKQTARDIKDINSRNNDIKANKKISGIQATDSALSAGKGLRNTAMGAMAGSYAYGALTGGQLMDPATMAIMMKGSSALSNPGSAAFLAANQMAGAHYLAGPGNTHMAALVGKGISGVGNIANSMGFTGVGNALGHTATAADVTSGAANTIGQHVAGFGDTVGNLTGMSGTAIGMLSYMLAAAGGNKLTKSIKSMANEKDTKKYNYRVADLGKPASTDIDVEKYDTMRSTANQINLLTVTGQLSPYESLALSYLQSINKHSTFLNAIFDLLNIQYGKKQEIQENTFLDHNVISDTLTDNINGEFTSTTDSYHNNKPKNYLERTGDRAAEVYDNLNKWVQKRSTDVSAIATLLNPVKILTGGLLGNSSTKDIKALYGTDEDTKKDKALEKTASEMNLPSNLIQLANMDISQVMKLSDSMEGKQLAVQAFIASLVQSILQMQLDSSAPDGQGFFDRNQRNLDELGSKDWYDKLKDKSADIIGNIPVLGMLSSIYAMKSGMDSRQKLDEEDAEITLPDTINFDNPAGTKKDDFINYQFPPLFLKAMSLDDERNQLLRAILLKDNCCGDSKHKNNLKSGKDPLVDIKPKTFGVYDTISETIGSEAHLHRNLKKSFQDKSEIIHSQYKHKIESDPKNEEKYLQYRDEELKELKKGLFKEYKQSTANLGSIGSNEEKKKDKKYKAEMLKAFQTIAKEHDKKFKPEGNLIDSKIGNKVATVGHALNPLNWLKGLGGNLGYLSKLPFKALKSIYLGAAGALAKTPRAFKGVAGLGALGLLYMAYPKYGNKVIGVLTDNFGKIGTAVGLVAGGKALSKSELMRSSLLSVSEYFSKIKPKGKVGMALAATVGLATLGYIYAPEIKKGIEKFRKIVSPYIGEFGSEDKKSDAIYGNVSKNRNAAGDILMTLGMGIMTIPGPVTAIGGALVAAAGLGTKVNWKNLFKDMLGRLPDWVKNLIPANMKKELGIPTKEEILKKYNEKTKAATFYREHKDFNNQNVLQLKSKIDLIKDDKEKEKLKSFLIKLDTDGNGKIDNDDFLKNKELFLKTQKDIAEEMNKYQKHLYEAYVQSTHNQALTAEQHAQALKQFASSQGTFNKVVSQLTQQIDSSRVNLTAISKKEALDSWGLSK